MSGRELDPIVSRSQTLAQVLERAKAVARTDTTALISGESGVGKELIAERIHEFSRRNQGPFVSMNCASIPRDLFESEFFGHIRGAFTGATRNRAGRIETAQRGTLFLDEVSEIPVELQGKLLRVLQNFTFERVGDDVTRQADVRFVTATNRDLHQDVLSGRFRLDLYYRLAVFPIEVPPLRQRREDIPVLAEHFLESLAKANGQGCKRLGNADVQRLTAYDWPGNVRELKNVIERALIFSGDGPLRIDLALPEAAALAKASDLLPAEQNVSRGYFTAPEFRELERDNMIGALEASSWKVSGEQGAAARLQMKPSTLSSRLKALDIRRPEPNSLYVRLGGHKGVATLVRELASRTLTDPQLSRFWANRSNVGLLREEQLLISYFAAAAGGPGHYAGRDLKSSHHKLGITSADWRIFQMHVEETLRVLRIADAEWQEIIGFMAAVQSQIVQA
jgi:transcriptional regulator with GAF, ATPase, and Fis domain/truncated hemoglobin YjbI